MLILIYLMIAAGLIAGVVYLARLMTEETAPDGSPLSSDETGNNNFENTGLEGDAIYNIYNHGVPFTHHPLS